MKILHVSSYYLDSNLYKKLIDNLNSINIENNVYCFAKIGTIVAKKLDSYVHLRYTYKFLDRYSFFSKHWKTFKDFDRYLNEKGYPDLIHAHSLFSNGYIAYKAYRKYNIPYIVAVRDTDVNFFFKKIPFMRPLGRKILDNAKKVIFISEPYRDSCIEKYVLYTNKKNILKKSEVITNGIDDIFLKNRNIKTKSDDKIRMICVGLISRRKNQKTTIDAFRELKKRGYNVSCTFLGQIRDESYYKKIKSEDVEFLSPIPQIELLNIYKQYDVFVMPSRTETFGLVYAEAMSQGLPVIYTKGQGFDGQFEEGEVGYSVDCKDYNEVANKIIDIMNVYSQMSSNCYKFSSKFDWQHIAAIYSEIYNAILD